MGVSRPSLGVGKDSFSAREVSVMVSASDLTVRFGGRLVLDAVSFSLAPGSRAGIVGPNGSGKTTLLSALAGAIRPDRGAVSLPPGTRVGSLAQGALPDDDRSLGDLLDTATGGLIRARRALDEAITGLAAPDGDPTDGERRMGAYDLALAGLEARGGFLALDDLDVLLARFGLAGRDMAIPIGSLSGGEKTRAALAALLLTRPDVLLLDEPTNHLDIDGLSWLEGFLATYAGTVIVVSHDRAFLDRVVTITLAIDPATGQVTRSAGGYGDLLAERERLAGERASAYRRQLGEIARVERDVATLAGRAASRERESHNDFQRARTKKIARTAKVRERRLERQLDAGERIEKPSLEWGLALDFGTAPESSRVVARLDGVGVTLGGRPILDDVSLQIDYRDRLAVTGPNGSGKSTLLRLIAGELDPDRGTVVLGPSVVVGHFTQEHAGVDPSRTVLSQALGAAASSESETRTFLHRFLFGGEMVHQVAGSLSFGERARLALALLVLRGANLLLMDEPLNHLDIPAREQFERALASYDGTLVLVSHDRAAIDRVATRTVVVAGGCVRSG